MIVDILHKSRLLMIITSIAMVLASFMCFFARGLNVIWYPRSEVDIWYTILFSLCLIGFAEILKVLITSLSKQTIIGIILQQTIKLLITLGYIIGLPALPHVIGRITHMYDYDMIEWAFGLMGSIILVFGWRFGYIDIEKHKKRIKVKRKL